MNYGGKINLREWDIYGDPFLTLNVDSTHNEVKAFYEPNDEVKKKIATIALFNNSLIIDTSKGRISINTVTKRVNIYSDEYLQAYPLLNAQESLSRKLFLFIILLVVVFVIFKT